MGMEVAAEKIKEDSIDSILKDIQALTGEMFKTASRLDSHADRLLGGKPSDEGSGEKDEPAAQTVIQRLRDLKRQLKRVHSNLLETANRLDGQF